MQTTVQWFAWPHRRWIAFRDHGSSLAGATRHDARFGVTDARQRRDSFEQPTAADSHRRDDGDEQFSSLDRRRRARRSDATGSVANDTASSATDSTVVDTASSATDGTVVDTANGSASGTEATR
jgi:hypothetical protein